MKKFKNLTIGLLLSLMGGAAFAQNGLESVIVEKYYVSNAADAAGSIGTLPVGSVTYRVYADLLPGYKFQAMYGVASHALKINSTTPFFNNEDRGNTNPAIGAAFINDNSVGLDSWFSVGGAANGNLGVLKSEDNGAANLITGCPILQNVDPTAGIGLLTQDGIMTGTPVAVTFVGLTAPQLEVFNATSNFGSSFTTSNGSIAALGGSVGATATNKVLIGQFTTTGSFHFELNIQIGTPTSGTQNYVASSPTGSEITIPSLTFTSPSVTVSSPVTYCKNATASALTATPSAGATLLWYTVPTGGTGSATAPTPSTAAVGTTSYYVSAIVAGIESPRSTINVVVNPGPTVTVNSPTISTCGASATLTAAGATTYSWSTSATTNPIVVTPASTTSYTVTGTTSGCTGSAVSLVTVSTSSTIAMPTTLTGTTTGLCPSGVASAVYTCASVAGATTYTWTAPAGATVTAGAGTTSATISFGPTFTSGNVSVTAGNACATSTAKLLAVRSTLLAPTTLTGPTTGLCPAGVSSAVYTCGTVTGATSYTWTAPAGATVTAGQGTTTATIDFGASFTSGNISVVSTNACGSSTTAKTLAVKSTVLAPTTLTGPTTGLCPAGVSSAVYTCGTVTGATSYTWTAPTGATVTAGQGTTTATITFGATFTTGNISVVSTNACGSSSTAKTLAVRNTLLAPTTLTGQTTGLCVSGTSSAVYTCGTVVGATSYIWTAPTGATITSGAGTTSVTISFGPTFTSGSISVKADNACGSSTAKTLVVYSTLLTPGVISGSTVVCASSTGNAYSILPVSGAASYLWTVPTGATITSGAGTNSIVVDFGVSVAGGITVKGVNACGNGLARTLTLSMTCMGTVSGDSKAMIENTSTFTADLYPNPTLENLSMNFVSDVDKDILVEIFNALGSKVSAQTYSITAGENTLNTNVSEYTNGLYFVHITDVTTNEVLNKTFMKQ